MTCRKYCNIKQGIILADVLVALALAVLLVMSVTQLSGSAREIYDSSTERNRLMNVYEAHANTFDELMPYESRNITLDQDDGEYDMYATTTISANARWYGNDRIETQVTVSTKKDSVTFVRIRLYPLGTIDDVIGTPICSVDFAQKDIVGSYGYKSSHSIAPNQLHASIIPISLPIDPTVPLTDVIIRNGIAYISTDSSRQSDPDILIFDIHDTSDTQLLAGLNTGPGISAITLAGNHVFAAVTSRTAQLQDLVINDLAHISIESSYKLPLPYASATPPLASSIFFDKNRVYLGTEKWDGDEFSIINVSDPAHPVRLSGLEIGSKINSIYVRNDTAYVADSNEQQLRVIHAADPALPQLVYGFNPSGWQRQEGKSISYFEDYVDFSRTSGGFNIKTDAELFSWGTSTSLLYGFPPTKSLDVPGGIYGIVRDRSYVYAISRQLGSELQMFDYSLSTSTSKVISLPVTPQALTCDNDSIYVLGANNPVLYKILFK